MSDSETEKIYKLSPSDLTFLYEGCKRCFSLKVKHGVTQPSMPLPGLFTVMGALQKDFYTDFRTEDICDDIPHGKITLGEKRVESRIFDVPNTNSKFYIKGRFDIVAELDDGTYAVIDFKTSKPTEDKNKMYGKQLHSYALSLENPAEGAISLSPVTRLGLLYFVPNNMSQTEKSVFNMTGDVSWAEIKRNDEDFLNFIYEVAGVLDGPLLEADKDCAWCKYLSNSNLLQNDFPNCPKCGGEMQLKKGKYGEFLSCKKYPECKGTTNI